MKLNFNKKGVSLVEMLVVVVIVGIAMATFYLVFLKNWEAFDILITRANLAQELDTVVDKIIYDARGSQTINIVNPKEVRFVDPSNIARTYRFNQNPPQVQLLQGNNPSIILSNSLDFANSSFSNVGTNSKTIQVQLSLLENIFGKNINVQSSFQVYRRN